MKIARFGSIELIKVLIVFWKDAENKKTIKDINIITKQSLPTTTINVGKLVQIGLVDKIPINSKDSYYKASKALKKCKVFEDAIKFITDYDTP